VTVEPIGRRLRVRLDRSGSYDPAQRDLELRLPADKRWVVVDGRPLELFSRELASEGRSVMISALRVPMEVREIWVV
jgi:hypothetical protein